MSPLRLLPRVPVRAFHSPFVALGASSRLASPSPSTAVPVYEKQDDPSPEPHLSSAGTRTYVVSEPDPSNTPYQVPSGAYPASAPYVTTPPEPPYSSAGASLRRPYNTHTVGGNAAETGHGGSHPVDVPGTKPGRF